MSSLYTYIICIRASAARARASPNRGGRRAGPGRAGPGRQAAVNYCRRLMSNSIPHPFVLISPNAIGDVIKYRPHAAGRLAVGRKWIRLQTSENPRRTKTLRGCMDSPPTVDSVAYNTKWVYLGSFLTVTYNWL